MTHTKASPIDPKLERRLGSTELSALRLRMRRHFERHGDNPDKAVLHLADLSSVEYEAIALLVGLPSRSTKSLRIDIDRIDAALSHAGIAESLRKALELIDGPIVHRSAARAALNARWASALSANPLQPTLNAWLATAAGVTMLKRVARQNPDAATRLLGQTDAVLRRLPAKGMTRAQLAADALGNAHALDGGQPTATLVLAVLRLEARDSTPESDLPDEVAEKDETAKPAERVRDVWARYGVLVNELARPALFLNLPVHPSSALPDAWGEPGYLSLRKLLRTTIAWSVADQVVYVCENPNIVSIAADRLGGACAPLICTDGMPAAAQRVLLTQLVHAGANLRYHGDFDWAGIHIANHVIQSFGARPWRFRSSDYIEAFKSIPTKERDLHGIGVVASWDTALDEHMRAHGLAIDEEAVAAMLINDLDRTAPIAAEK